MKKLFTKSWLANLLISCHTISLFGFINTKKKELDQTIINHEVTHIDQWEELTILGYAMVSILVLDGETKWLLIFPPLIFYIWYIMEWIVRLLMKGNAYKNISFEREAYTNEKDCNYNENRNYFSFLHYLTIKK